MPRLRNSNIGLVCLGATIICLLWYVLGGASSPTSSYTDFRKTTESALNMKDHMTKMGKEYLSDKDMLGKANQELQGILRQQQTDGLASENVAEVHQSMPDTAPAEPDEISIAGRVKMPRPKSQDSVAEEKPRYPSQLVDESGKTNSKSKAEGVTDVGREAARTELQQILKRSPIIIFSKSTCPYSRRAKNLLLNTYTITPAPYVVELNEMSQLAPANNPYEERETMGKKLQTLLLEMTGRRTVPNIMVGMKSIGGSDELARLHAEGKLEDTLRKHGSKQIVDVKRVEQ